MQVFNPEFVARVHAKRRPPQPTHAEVVAAARLARREAALSAASAYKRRTPEPSYPGRESVMEIITRIAKSRCVPPAAVLGAKRWKWLVLIRHEAMVEVALKRPDLSLPQIGKAFGRDHTCVLNALKKFGFTSRPRVNGETLREVR